MRTTVRMVLGNYLGIAPGDLEIAYSQYGKPYISTTRMKKDIHFNLSHAGDVGLIAVAISRHIGVDLELVRQESSIESIAKRFFTPEEAGHLLSLPASLQPEAFFTCWTRKEAFVKARGEGLSIHSTNLKSLSTPTILHSYYASGMIQVNLGGGRCSTWIPAWITLERW